jgi:hypothetical protein
MHSKDGLVDEHQHIPVSEHRVAGRQSICKLDGRLRCVYSSCDAGRNISDTASDDTTNSHAPAYEGPHLNGGTWLKPNLTKWEYPETTSSFVGNDVDLKWTCVMLVRAGE